MILDPAVLLEALAIIITAEESESAFTEIANEKVTSTTVTTRWAA